MSAACPLIVSPGVCSPLCFPTRDQVVPRRWPSVRQWSKHWKPLILIRSTCLQWLPIVPIGAIGSINDTCTYLLRHVYTQYRHASTAWKLCSYADFSCCCLCSAVFFHVLRGTYAPIGVCQIIIVIIRLRLSLYCQSLLLLTILPIVLVI